MSLPRPKRIVVLGMMSKMPVAGVVWQTLHYLIGFQRLGYDVHYVEAHARTPGNFMESAEDDGWAKAAGFIARTLERFNLGDSWAYDALDVGRSFGKTDSELKELYASADLLVNLHGGTLPRPELADTGRLVYVETDPVDVQIQLHEGNQETIEFLRKHVAHFSFAENYGASDCKLPVSEDFRFRPTRQPVVLDFWNGYRGAVGSVFTTISNWRQPWRNVRLNGEVYHWSKHREFMKFLDVPSRTGQKFELALSSYSEEERETLNSRGWTVRDALRLSKDLDAYRDYIGRSRGEFTVAKDQNVRLRSGWFSDRSATYLAAGRPVVTQETGFSARLPIGKGLFSFQTMDDIVSGIEAITADYEEHSRAAFDLARDFFSSDRVLSQLLDDIGLDSPSRRLQGHDRDTIPESLMLTPTSRRPIRLRAETLQLMESLPTPSFHYDRQDEVSASLILVTFNELPFTRLCLASLLANSGLDGYEVIVVDNGSSDGTRQYLQEQESKVPNLRVILNERNRGFAPALNQGLAAARGGILVILNNDVVVPPAWLSRLARHLDRSDVGLVGPVTNRCGNEAQVETDYNTYGEFLKFAEKLSQEREGASFDIQTPMMFCVALRRDVYEKVGGLDERFEVGLFEDDDYAMRVREIGLKTVCAEDVFIHHFGEVSFGRLFPSGRRGEVFETNRDRYEQKWGAWHGHPRLPATEGEETTFDARSAYGRMASGARQLVLDVVPPGAVVLVVSRGDDRLLNFDGRVGRHFPQTRNGQYAGYHPGSDTSAIGHLEWLRSRGAGYLLFPRTSFWWLDHYQRFRRYLEGRYRLVVEAPDVGALYDLRFTSSLSGNWQRRFEDSIRQVRERLARDPTILDWSSGLELESAFPDEQIFTSSSEDRLPYLDRSIDVVVLPGNHPSALAEARRVSLAAVITVGQSRVPNPNETSFGLEWRMGRSQTAGRRSVSIIIPTYNAVGLIDGCLKSVAETLPRTFETEVVVVDDASRDGTRTTLRQWRRRGLHMRVIRNWRNRGFIDACNRGAKVAEGEFLIFLNNDTVVTEGWLQQLVGILATQENVGAVGGKLLYPDGRLQEAGGLIFSDGSGANFGRGNYNPDGPLFNFLRNADYCSGALLATPRSVFRSLGGFDIRYRPAYYEDADYFFSVRAEGMRTYYRPESVVVHDEGSTSGTDTTSGVKRYQVRNRDKFVEKWSRALKQQPKRPDNFDSSTLSDLALWRREGERAFP